MNYSWFDLYKYSLKLGLRYISKVPKYHKEGLKRLLIPMDIARYFELPATANSLEIGSKERILDLSSAKLLSLFLSEKSNCEIIAVDMWKKEINNWETFINIIDQKKTILSVLTLEVADGRCLTYPDEYFDKIYSISVLEHIPDDGDTRTIIELARVLKKGGVLVITVPYSERYYETYVSEEVYGRIPDKKEKILWARRYDEIALEERLIQPSKLSFQNKSYCCEKYPIFSDLHGRLLPFSAIFCGLFYPIFAKISLRVSITMPSNPSRLTNVLLKLKK